MMRSSWVCVLVVGLAGLGLGSASLGAADVQSQGAAASVVGPWEGTAQTPNGPVNLKATFTLTDGKLGGTVESSLGPIAVQSASYADGKLTVGIEYEGSAGTLTGIVQGPRIEGTWQVAGSSGTFVLARPGTGASAAPVAAGDPITGAWEGEVNIAGQIMPFSMALRLNGDTVGGEMTSSAGAVPLASGAWKDGTLLLTFPYTSGEPVSMAGQLQDGKLSGIVDYNRGEATGTFTAARKQ
jgi:hypothetical protein